MSALFKIGKCYNRAVLLLITLISSSPVFPQINFDSPAFYDAGTKPEVVCIGDVNGDTLNDVVVGSKYVSNYTKDCKIFVFLQNGSGDLSIPVPYSYPGSYPDLGIRCIAIQDVNNDTLKDVIISFSDSIGIYYQNSSHSLNPVQVYESGSSGGINGLSVGDLNGDSLNDIALSHSGASVITVLYQQKGGGFNFVPYPAPEGYNNQIEIADINNDQKNDVVLMVGMGLNAGIYAYIQTALGTLQKHEDYNKGFFFHGMAIGDLNNDTKNDIVELVQETDNKKDTVLVLYNNNIKIPKYIASDYKFEFDTYDIIKTANINCEAYSEIIIVQRSGNASALVIFEYDKNSGKYKRTLWSVSVAYPANHHGIDIGDIDNDGRKDIVCITEWGQIAALKNATTDKEKPKKPTGDVAICEDNISSIYKSSVSNDDIVMWDILPKGARTNVTSTKDSCLISWNNNYRGKAGITVSVKNSCGINTSDTLVVNIVRLSALNLGSDTTLCTNNTLNINARTGFDTYKWQDNSTDSIFTVTTGGVYSVEVTNICGTAHDTVFVTDVPLPVVNISDTYLCPDSSVILDATLSGVTKYQWQNGPSEAVYLVDESGQYSVMVTDSNNCVNNKTIEVKDISLPVVNFPTDTTVCSNRENVLDASFLASTYLWHDGSTSSLHKADTTGIYSVAVTNACGTTNKSVSVIVENCDCYLDVPTAFSPNNDGNNDILYAVGNKVQNLLFIIYNRWGQKVFESKSFDVGWDGTFKGMKLDPAVFIYYVTANSVIDGHLVQNHGNVTLIR